ncbi:MAG TPA: hypothetical protein VK964_01590 [Nocardioidaceae bacterium]|nr:hypothetical protein [Nocardioidaceae bacterium]
MSVSRAEHEQEVERQRMLAAVFGEPLPRRTRDESADGWGEQGTPRGGAGDDDWLRSEVPPHHG